MTILASHSLAYFACLMLYTFKSLSYPFFMTIQEKSFKYTKVRPAPNGIMLTGYMWLITRSHPWHQKIKSFKNRNSMIFFLKDLLSKSDRRRNAFDFMTFMVTESGKWDYLSLKTFRKWTVLQVIKATSNSKIR